MNWIGDNDCYEDVNESNEVVLYIWWIYDDLDIWWCVDVHIWWCVGVLYNEVII